MSTPRYIDASKLEKAQAARCLSLALTDYPRSPIVLFGHEELANGNPRVATFPPLPSGTSPESFLARVGFGKCERAALLVPLLPDGRKTFALVVPWMALGGADRCGVDLLRHFRDRGWRTVVVATRHDPGSNSRLSEFEEVSYDIRLTPNVLSGLRGLDPSVIVVNNSHEAYAQAGEIREAFPNARLAALVHMVLPAPWDFEKSLQKETPFDTVLTISNRLRGELGVTGVPSEKMKTLHWFGFQNAGERMETKPKQVLCPFRFHRQKRPEFVCDIAAALLRIVGPRKMPTFVLAGGGNLEGAIIERARELGVSPFLSIRTGLGHADIRKLMASTSALLCPSEDEGIPLVYYEGLQWGIPLAVSDVGAVSELVPDVFRIPLRCDFEEERYAVLLKAHLEGRSKRVAELARRSVENNFSKERWDAMVQRLFP